MIKQEILDLGRAAGALFVAAVVPLALGIGLFMSRRGIGGGVSVSRAAYLWERGGIMAAAVLTAVGFVLLADRLSGTPGGTWARIGSALYFLGAAVLLTAESLKLSMAGASFYPLIVAYVLLAFSGQVAVGGGLLQSQLLPGWIGWAAVGWNLGWLVLLPLLTPQDIYYPILHHLIPFLIGGALLLRR